MDYLIIIVLACFIETVLKNYEEQLNKLLVPFFQPESIFELMFLVQWTYSVQ